MGFSNIVRLFTPKDRIFYSLFEQLTENLVNMSKVFVEGIAEKDFTKRSDLLRSLENYEHKCDEVTHTIFIELGKNFITPFDREDIHSLASALDDVADYMWGSAKRILNYQLAETDDTMLGFSGIIVKCVTTLHTGIHELRNMKDMKAITDCCVAINSLENDADDLLDLATVRLFTTHNIDPIHLVKLKDLYQEMELVTDKCEDAANVIESIIIKYA